MRRKSGDAVLRISTGRPQSSQLAQPLFCERRRGYHVLSDRVFEARESSPPAETNASTSNTPACSTPLPSSAQQPRLPACLRRTFIWPKGLSRFFPTNGRRWVVCCWKAFFRTRGAMKTFGRTGRPKVRRGRSAYLRGGVRRAGMRTVLAVCFAKIWPTRLRKTAMFQWG